LVLFFPVLLFICGCFSSAVAQEIDVSPLPGLDVNLAEAFAKHYKPVPEDFIVKMPSYILPLDYSEVSNLKSVESKYLTNSEAKDFLAKHGFVIVRGHMV